MFESDSEDMERNLLKGGVNRLYYGGTESPIVKLRGLPFSVSDEQIKEFFSGLKVVSLKVRIFLVLLFLQFYLQLSIRLSTKIKLLFFEM